jgi:hypothetical protein
MPIAVLELGLGRLLNTKVRWQSLYRSGRRPMWSQADAVIVHNNYVATRRWGPWREEACILSGLFGDD